MARLWYNAKYFACVSCANGPLLISIPVQELSRCAKSVYLVYSESMLKDLVVHIGTVILLFISILFF